MPLLFMPLLCVETGSVVLQNVPQSGFVSLHPCFILLVPLVLSFLQVEVSSRLEAWLYLGSILLASKVLQDVSQTGHNVWLSCF